MLEGIAKEDQAQRMGRDRVREDAGGPGVGRGTILDGAADRGTNAGRSMARRVIEGQEAKQYESTGEGRIQKRGLY